MDASPRDDAGIIRGERGRATSRLLRTPRAQASRLRRSLSPACEILVRLGIVATPGTGPCAIRQGAGGPLLARTAAVVLVGNVGALHVGGLPGGVVDADADAGLRH